MKDHLATRHRPSKSGRGPSSKQWTNDALAQGAAVPELATDADVDERIAVLPEPWRSRTRHELKILKGRIKNTLEEHGAGA